VPGKRILTEWCVELWVGPEARHERRLVVRRASHEAITEPRPRGNGVPRCEQFLGRRARRKKLVRADPIGVDGGEEVTLRRIMERVVEAHDRAGGIAEGGVRRHILDALTVDVDLAGIA